MFKLSILYLIICFLLRSSQAANCILRLPVQDLIYIEMGNEENCPIKYRPENAPKIANVYAAGAKYTIGSELANALNTTFDTIGFSGMAGVDLKGEQLTAKSVFFYYSEFKLWFGEQPVTRQLCSYLIGQNFSMASLRSAESISYFKSCRFYQNTCPIFLSSELAALTLSGIARSLISRNEISFAEWQARLNVSLVKLSISGYRFKLEPRTISLALMENTSSLLIDGQIETIQKELFNNFRKLRVATFRRNNLAELFHRNTQWMESFNRSRAFTNFSIALYEEQPDLFLFLVFFEGILETWDALKLNNVYLYPDEDFCLFRSLFQSPLILPVIIIQPQQQQQNCSCTAYFLTQFSSQIPIDPSDLPDVPDWFHWPSLQPLYCDSEQMAVACKFEKMANNCFISQVDDDHFLLLTYTDQRVKLKFAEYIATVYVLPTSCLLGIVTNILTLSIMRNKEVFKDQTRRFMTISCIFNLSLSCLLLFETLILCIDEPSIYCSTARSSAWTQYLKIIGLNFGRNLLKFCNEVSLLGVSLVRYRLASGRRLNRFFTWLLKLKLKNFICALGLLGTLLSLVKIFQFEYIQVNRFQVPDDARGLPAINNFLIYSFFSIDDDKLIFKYDSIALGFYIFFDFLNLAITDLTLFISNVYYDSLLVKVCRQNVESKRLMFQSDQSSRKEKQLLKAEETASRVLSSVMITSIASFSLRFPSVAFNTYFDLTFGISHIFGGQENSICMANFAMCRSVIAIVQSIFSFSLFVNFFILLRFTPKFKISQAFKI
nr:G protein-coupled receptor [Proales similis]